MYKPLITIITPTYNHEKYIAECIESVLNQTYENWEMIIIDDCSNDKTYEIAKKYAEKDKRIKLIRHSENYGALNLDKTYNEALSIANGEWIAILEGDDVWPHYKLEKQITTLKDLPDNVILLHGNVGYIHEDIGKVTLQSMRVSLIEKPPSGVPYNAFKFLIYGFNPVYSQTTLIKKSALIKIGGFVQDPKEIMLVDFPTWLRLSKIGNFYYENCVLGFWRRHCKSITINNQDIIAINFRKAVVNFLNEYNDKILLKNPCIGVFQYFGAIFASVQSGQLDKTEFFLKELKKCIDDKVLPVSQISKLKLLLFKIIIKLKQPWILKFLYTFKKTNIDRVIYDYRPFFFKDEKFIKKIENL